MTGENLKKFIMSSGISLTEMSKRLEMSPQHLNQALSVADIKSGLIERVAVALGVSIAAVYSESQARTNITGNGSGVNAVNNDPDVINRFLALLEKKDEQIQQLIAKL